MDEFDAVAFGCPAMGDEVLEETVFEPVFLSCESKLNGKNIALFDIVSFLSENNIDDENLQHKFLKMYYGKVDETLLNEVKIMYSFLDVLWTYWAKAMYIKYNEEVFNDIALEKTSRYNLIDDTY